MTINNEDELNPLEKEAMRNIRESISGPAGLEEDIIAQLKEKQLITNNNNTMKLKQHFVWAAAAAAALICGFFIGQNFNDQQTTIPGNMNKYMLLLYENEEFQPKEIGLMVQEYTDWATDLAQKGKLDHAEKLADKGNWLGNVSARNKQSNVSGYFVILATDLDEATALAKTHPHIDYGGGVELRPIDNLN